MHTVLFGRSTGTFVPIAFVVIPSTFSVADEGFTVDNNVPDIAIHVSGHG